MRPDALGRSHDIRCGMASEGSAVRVNAVPAGEAVT
jgi:hypothetical protein